MSNATLSAHRRQFLGGAALALAAAAAAPGQALSQTTSTTAAPASGAEPPRDWIDAKTGHRIVRLSNDPSSPISKLPVAIMSMVVTSTNFRPRLSAIRPNTMPPSGRIKNPTANTARVESRAETGSS